MTSHLPPRIVLIILALAGMACNFLFPTPSPFPTESAECDATRAIYSLSDEANGQTLVVAVGDTLAVSLASNPTTGYEWEVLTIDPVILRFDGKSYAGSFPAAVGSGGAETLCFTALAQGSTQLALMYHRPFETGIPPLETFAISLEVQ